MISNNEDIILKEGPSWIWGGLGICLICFAGFIQIGGAPFSETWSVWLLGLICIWLFRAGKITLDRRTLTARNSFWKKRTYQLNQLRWLQFETRESIFLEFENHWYRISNQTKHLKKFRAELRKYAEKNIAHFEYEPATRQTLKRHELSGCLDCHNIFPLEDIKNWRKLNKSFWRGRKTDVFSAKCPHCTGPWVYKSGNESAPLTLEGIRGLDEVFKKVPGTEKRKFPNV